MNILITIVLYKCKLNDSVSFNCLRKQVNPFLSECSFFIYDNSPSVDSDAADILKDYGMSFYYHDVNNSGVSRAYNEAAAYAKKNGFQWLLLLDQDTVLPSDIMGIYMVAIREHNDIPMFAPKVKIADWKFISPCRFYLKQGRCLRNVNSGLTKTKHRSVINSGLLISLKAYLNSGGYNDRVYLDYSDHEFFTRFKSRYKYFYVLDVELLQDFACVSKDRDKLMSRYRVLCDCVQHVTKKSLWEWLLYYFMLFRRGAHLYYMTKEKEVLNIFLNYKM